MAQVAASPKVRRTKEQKKLDDNKYRKDVKQFTLLLKAFVRVFNALQTLSMALGQAGKGNSLHWANPLFDPNRANDPTAPETISKPYREFNRKNLRSAQAMFTREFMVLKQYLRVSKKKTREAIKPESFAGTYTPVYAGAALQTFFRSGAAGFGALSPLTAQYAQGSAESAQQANILLQDMGASNDRYAASVAPYQNAIARFNQVSGLADTDEQYIAAKEALDATKAEYDGAKDAYDSQENHRTAWTLANGNMQQYEALLHGSLSDLLVQVRDGYLLRNTSTMLFYIYAHAQNLQSPANAQFASSDAVMNNAFNNPAIPATFFAYKGGDGKNKKDLMALSGQNLTTYEVIANIRPDFNQPYDVIKRAHPVKYAKLPNLGPGNWFQTYFYQNIAAANYYSQAYLAAAGLNDQLAALAIPKDQRGADQRHQEMLNEHNIVKSVSNEWKIRLEPTRTAAQQARKAQAKK